MEQKPFYKSRKFLTAMLDVVVSVALFFVGKYVLPMYAEDIIFLIGILQPVFVAVIAGIAWEDAAFKRNPNNGVG